LEKDWKVWFEREKRSNINNALLYETFALDFFCCLFLLIITVFYYDYYLFFLTIIIMIIFCFFLFVRKVGANDGSDSSRSKHTERGQEHQQWEP
jgi:uncharacterized membrane protein